MRSKKGGRERLERGGEKSKGEERQTGHIAKEEEEISVFLLNRFSIDLGVVEQDKKVERDGMLGTI